MTVHLSFSASVQHEQKLICRRQFRQAAREIASTIATSQNRVFLNSDSLLLNLSDVQVDGQK